MIKFIKMNRIHQWRLIEYFSKTRDSRPERKGDFKMNEMGYLAASFSTQSVFSFGRVHGRDDGDRHEKGYV